jgi:hypothetical protein
MTLSQPISRLRSKGELMRINSLLLDTHVFLWWRADDPQLQDAARSTIPDTDVVFVSSAIAWLFALRLPFKDPPLRKGEASRTIC